MPNRDLARQVMTLMMYNGGFAWLALEAAWVGGWMDRPGRGGVLSVSLRGSDDCRREALIDGHSIPPSPPIDHPTPPLIQQVTSEIESLGQYLDPKLRIKCCVGSPNVKTEEARDERIALVKSLKTEPPHVLVGTMGRVCDLAEGRDRSGPVIWCVGACVGGLCSTDRPTGMSSCLATRSTRLTGACARASRSIPCQPPPPPRLKNTKFLVLDEADEMLFDCRNPEVRP